MPPLVGFVDAAVEFLASEPVFVLLVAALLGLTLFLYLLARRTLLSLQEGFDEGKRS
ncbi:MAG: hypothetical protein ABEJ79_08220 [Halolamina sp.]